MLRGLACQQPSFDGYAFIVRIEGGRSASLVSLKGGSITGLSFLGGALVVTGALVFPWLTLTLPDGTLSIGLSGNTFGTTQNCLQSSWPTVYTWFIPALGVVAGIIGLAHAGSHVTGSMAGARSGFSLGLTVLGLAALVSSVLAWEQMPHTVGAAGPLLGCNDPPLGPVLQVSNGYGRNEAYLGSLLIIAGGVGSVFVP